MNMYTRPDAGGGNRVPGAGLLTAEAEMRAGRCGYTGSYRGGTTAV